MTIDDPGALALERALISETIFRYHRAFDQKDWETCRDLFTDTVEIETSGMEGSVAQTQNFARDRLIRILQRMGPADTVSQHLSANHIIDISGDEATCIASSIARTSRPQDGENALSAVGGTYTFTLVRTQNGWKIRKYRFDQAWSEQGLS